ncbi:MAG: ABC transporter permease [Bacilli bacterium]|nr:ABC transporter permease [Bacilli bacterium]MDD4795017.1 ABC transporter permease [Bacilli bacterium]
MIVFSNYLKILKQYTAFVVLYVVIFTIFSIIFTIYSNDNPTFAVQKPNIAIINNEDTKLVKSFLDYIKTTSNIVEMDSEDLKDALFYRKVDLILTFPPNFTNDFLNNDNPEINIQRVPDSSRSIYAIMYLNRYLNIASLYNSNNVTMDKLIEYIELDLKLETNIVFNNKNTTLLSSANYFYNFSSYSILAISVSVIGMMMSSFKLKTIQRRNMISPMSYSKQNNSLFLGNLLVTMGVWLLFTILGICFFRQAIFSANGVLFMINSLVFSITASSMGFFIGNVINNKEAISSIVNVVALGSSFICGAFVPQEILGESVLKIAKFFPTYWFVKGNNEIVILSKLSLDKMEPICINIIMTLLFALLFFMLNKIILKFRLKEN